MAAARRATADTPPSVKGAPRCWRNEALDNSTEIATEACNRSESRLHSSKYTVDQTRSFVTVSCYPSFWSNVFDFEM